MVLCNMTYYRYFGNNIRLSETPIVNGVIPQEFAEPLVISGDELKPSPIKLTLDLDDGVVMSDDIAKTYFVTEYLKLRERFAIKHYIPGRSYTVGGMQIGYGSEVPVGGATVHVIKRFTHPTFIDTINLFNGVKVVHYRAGEELYYDPGVFGYWDESDFSEPIPPEPELRDVLPRGNAPAYTGVTAADGYFEIVDLPEGVYTIVSMKQGYSHGFFKLDLNAETKDDPIVLTMYPIRPWEYVERVYNKLGNMFKVYFYSDGISDIEYKTGVHRVVEGFLVFGDLYNTAAGTLEGYKDEEGNPLPGAPAVPAGGKIRSDGKLHCMDEYTVGWLDILPFPYTGSISAFERGEPDDPDNETLTLDIDRKVIEWKSAITMGEFDGFAFRYVFPRNMTGVLYFSLGAPLVVPGEDEITNPETPSETIDTSETSPSSGGDGSGGDGSGGDGSGGWSGGGWSGWHWNPWWTWRPSTSYTQTDRIYVKDDTFSACVSENFDELEPAPKRCFMPFYNVHYSQDPMRTPPTVSLTGIVLGTRIDHFRDEETGYEWSVTLYDAPIEGANITIRAVRNGKIVGRAASDAGGFWVVGGLPSELEYEIYVTDIKNEFYSTVSKVQVHDKDVIDDRVRVLLEGEIFGKETGIGYEYYEAKIIIPPLNVRLEDDGRIYGLVRDVHTKQPIVGAIVRAIPGHLTQEEIDNYTGAEMYVFTTYQRDDVDDGFYEIYLPCGDYTLQAFATGYDDSQIYHGTVQAGWHQIIEMEGTTITGMVYDGPDYGAGILTPLEGAVITFEDVTAVSRPDGSFGTYIGEIDLDRDYEVSCSRVDYVTAVKRIRPTQRSIHGMKFVLWPVSHYTGKRSLQRSK